VLAALALAVGAPHGQGANLTAYTPNAYRQPAAVAALDDLRDTGLRRAAVVVTWYMHDSRASTVVRDPLRTPTDASITALAAAARERGISLLIKPQIDIQDETFRGDIEPFDRSAWWQSYRAMIDHYAGLADHLGADALTIGVELRSMSTDTLEFEQLIAQARERFDGTLLYAANWDEVEDVAFWPALDAIGVDAYYPLATHPGASVLDLATAWRPIAARLRQLSERVDRPVLFTELGYAARPDAAVDPSGAYRSGGPVDVDAQARAYEATLRALGDERWLRGIYWWDWPIDPRDAGGQAYSPRDRPAQAVIRQAALGEDGEAGGGVLGSIPWPVIVIVGIWVSVAVGFLAVIRAASRADDSGAGRPGPVPPDPLPEPSALAMVDPPPHDADTAVPDLAPEEAEPAVDAAPIARPAIRAAPRERADALRDLGAIDLDHLAEIVTRVMAVDMTAILVRAPDDPDTLVSAGEFGVSLRGRRWPADSGLAAMVLARGERVAIHEYGELDKRIGADQTLGVRTAASAPLVTRTGLRGGVSVASRDAARRMEVADLELLSTLTEFVAAAMDHPAETVWPDAGARGQVEGLVSAMDARDRDERRRSTMLVAMADRVGARLLPSDSRARAELTIAARLHDVGMLRVPVTPLQRAAPLAGDVERLVAAHPAWGADLLAAIPGLQAVAAYVRFHQERWDGSGYPHGLAGERIPLVSRIVAACEAWAAMVIGRPHAAARSPEHAVEELRRAAGTQFDPAVVEVIVSVSPTMPRPLPRVVTE
jgi:HD-GYP domain-containing protein (c-di-GMP phosphodiesterase class II)